MARLPESIVAACLALTVAGTGSRTASETPPVLRPEPETTQSAERPKPAPGANDVPSTANGNPSLADVQRLARGHNALGVELWKRLAGTGNASLSPASIGIALGMTYLGARTETAAEMKRAMRLELEPATVEAAHRSLLARWRDTNGETLHVEVANRLFVHKALPVVREFARATRDGFSSPAEVVDFAGAPEPSRAHINKWVEQQTHERIRDLVPRGGVIANTRMVLANALYFKSRWAEPFVSELTTRKPFFTADGQSRSVPTMMRIAALPYRDAGDVEIAKLAYQSGPFEFCIILPKRRDGLSAVEATLTAEMLERWVGSTADWQRLRLELPTFKIEPAGVPLRLRTPLIAMGMRLAFDPSRADFTGIHEFTHPDDRLLISEVFHKSFVAVDEAGTEAAAATAVSMMLAGSAARPDAPRPFVADHPFLFAIRDRDSGLILFLGRVADPSAE